VIAYAVKSLKCRSEMRLCSGGDYFLPKINFNNHHGRINPNEPLINGLTVSFIGDAIC
jgi:hypothetical protein